MQGCGIVTSIIATVEQYEHSQLLRHIAVFSTPQLRVYAQDTTLEEKCVVFEEMEPVYSLRASARIRYDF